MPKFFQVATNLSPALADFILGVTAGGVDQKITLTQLAALVSANITDGSIKAADIDFSVAGQVWWQELGRSTLAVAGDTISVSFTAKKYLRVIVSVQGAGGTISVNLVFNSDSAANYSFRQSDNGGVDTTGTAQSNVPVTGAATYANLMFMADIINIAAQEKLLLGNRFVPNTAGAANAPNRSVQLHKWANTVAQISSMSMTNVGGGDYAIGSSLVILGHD